MKRDVFLSHAGCDKEAYVVPFAGELKRRGISYWLDRSEIKWGDKITKSINQGLRDASFVVVFLSDAFMERNWPRTELETALFRETAEGKTLVLPVIIGDPDEILRDYPQLMDKSYEQWTANIPDMVEKLDRLLFIAKPQPKIELTVRGNHNTTSVSPDLLFDFMNKQYSHNILKSSYVCEHLRRCGLLANVLQEDGLAMEKDGLSMEEDSLSMEEDSLPIEVNGHRVDTEQGTEGGPGIGVLTLTEFLCEFVSGEPPVIPFIGMGFRFGHAIGVLSGALKKRIEELDEQQRPSDK